jgi:hypothetical protein
VIGNSIANLLTREQRNLVEIILISVDLSQVYDGEYKTVLKKLNPKDILIRLIPTVSQPMDLGDWHFINEFRDTYKRNNCILPEMKYMDDRRLVPTDKAPVEDFVQLSRKRFQGLGSHLV